MPSSMTGNGHQSWPIIISDLRKRLTTLSEGTIAWLLQSVSLFISHSFFSPFSLPLISKSSHFRIDCMLSLFSMLRYQLYNI